MRVWHRACKGGMQHRALIPRQGTEQNNRSSGERRKGKRNMPRTGATEQKENVPGGVCVVGKRREDRGVLLPHKFTRIEKDTTQKANNKQASTDTQENRGQVKLRHRRTCGQRLLSLPLQVAAAPPFWKSKCKADFVCLPCGFACAPLLA